MDVHSIFLRQRRFCIQNLTFLFKNYSSLSIYNYIVSYRILELQKNRFFDHLQAKHWNSSQKGDCDNTDNNEGITLESLGIQYTGIIKQLFITKIFSRWGFHSNTFRTSVGHGNFSGRSYLL